MTPESEKCGNVRNKALGAVITPLIDHKSLMDLIHQLLECWKNDVGWIKLTKEKTFRKECMVIDVYGGLIGWLRNPFELYKRMVQKRRNGTIYRYLGLYWDRRRNIFYFNCDEGRFVRPLLILNDWNRIYQVLHSAWYDCHPNQLQHLLLHGVVEYLDAEEEESDMILVAADWDWGEKTNFDHTHMEIHGCFLMSITDNKAFANHNQGPRRMYTGNMENRSIASKAQPDRGTTVSYNLRNAQVPLVSDPIDETLDLRQQEPNGTNALVSVLSLGENVEDAWIGKTEAFERGMGLTEELNIVHATLHNHYSFIKPPSNCQGLASADKYECLLPDGTPKMGATIKGGSAVVGRVLTYKDNKQTLLRCVSKFTPWNMDYKVANVERYPEDQRYTKVIRVTLVRTNFPTVGDKFYFAHGQKGTIGRMIRSYDLPWISSGPNAGIVPDLFINVCSLSRVTQGLLIEMMVGKARCFVPHLISQYDNLFLNAKSFKERMKLVTHVLKICGMQPKGKERMRLGTTGEEIDSPVYTGMVYLHVLKHMSRDKLRARDRGPTNELTRQTTVGKKNFGGQKCGEMENWNLRCYGMAEFFRNVNYENADRFQLWWCTKCHMQAIGCPDIDFYWCKSCDSEDHLKRLPIAYISNLVMQELMPAGLGHTLIVEGDEGYGDAYFDEKDVLIK